MTAQLERLGYSPFFAGHFAAYAEMGYVPARVVTEHRGAYRARGEDFEGWAVLSGKLRHEAQSALDLPAVGDWVALDQKADDSSKGSRALVHAVLPRATSFTRRAAGLEKKPQVVATNIDKVFLLSSLNRDFSPRRLERYLALSRESGAMPIILLSKADLVDSNEAAEAIDAVEKIARGAPIHTCSSVTGQGIEIVREALSGNKTGVLLGSSGVGKSTLINRLLGEEKLLTSSIREIDDKGRHTTVRRELFLLPPPGDGILIDTPGMREIGLWDSASGVDETFDDVADLSADCRFSDCRHETEPGCAIRKAVEEGSLMAERLESYRALQKEGERVEMGRDARSRSIEKRRNRVMARAVRNYLKNKRGS